MTVISCITTGIPYIRKRIKCLRAHSFRDCIRQLDSSVPVTSCFRYNNAVSKRSS